MITVKQSCFVELEEEMFQRDAFFMVGYFVLGRFSLILWGIPIGIMHTCIYSC
jgi:hypothetical protein